MNPFIDTILNMVKAGNSNPTDIAIHTYNILDLSSDADRDAWRKFIRTILYNLFNAGHLERSAAHSGAEIHYRYKLAPARPAKLKKGES